MPTATALPGGAGHLASWTDAKRAFEDAKVQLAAAQADRDEAANLVEAAKAKASQLVVDATAAAERITSVANDAAADMRASAVNVRSDADAYADKLKAQVDAVKADVVKLKEDLAGQIGRAKYAEEAASGARLAAEKAEAEANESASLFRRKIATLHSALEDVANLK